MIWFLLLILFLLNLVIRQKIIPDSWNIIFIFNIFAGFLIVSFYVYMRSFKSKIRILEINYEKEELRLSDEEESTTILEYLRKIVDVLGEEPDLEVVLNKFAEMVSDLLKVENVILQLYSDEERKFFMRVLKGRKEIELADRILKEDVIEEGRSHLINNLISFPFYKVLYEQGFRSFIVAPLRRRNRIIGLIAALSEKEGEFTSQKLDILTIISAEAGLIVENAHLLEKTKLLSITDGLTEIYNHRHFQECIRKEIEKTEKANFPLSLIMGDIDNFKNYNDTNGHPEGDKVLREIAQILKRNTKGSDTVARYGGEEFVIILPNTTKENALIVAENLRKKIEESKFPFEEKSQPTGKLTITFGVANYPLDAKSVRDLIKEADRALYRGKEEGKNRVVEGQTSTSHN